MVATVTDKVKFIQSAFGSGRLSRSSQNIDVWCPVCAPTDKSKKKLSIRLADDANHCWTCDWKARSLVPLLKRFGSRELLSEYVAKFFQGKTNPGFDEAVVERVRLPDDFRLLALSDERDPDVRAALRYVFEKRGLKRRDLWFYKLGISDDYRWKRRVIVPSFDATGELNYYVGRAIDEQRKPKYDNPDNDKLQVVFNELNVDWTQPLVLCEGAFDMVKCGENAVPLLGSRLNEESRLFNMIIAHGTPIDLALDADMFETRTQSIAKKLMQYDVDVRIVDVRPFPDPGKMTRDQFEQCRAIAKPFDWNDSFLVKLQRATKTSLTL